MNNKFIEVMLSDLSVRTEGVTPQEFAPMFSSIIGAINNPVSPVEDVKKPVVEELVLQEPETYVSPLKRPRKETDKKEAPTVTPYNPPKKPYTKLVFFKCPDCGETFCSLVDLNSVEEVACRCGELIPVDENILQVGSYVCPDCNATGRFLMHPDVIQVKCKDCDNLFYMVQDADTKEFEGKIF